MKKTSVLQLRIDMLNVVTIPDGIKHDKIFFRGKYWFVDITETDGGEPWTYRMQIGKDCTEANDWIDKQFRIWRSN